jgi:hypothetical protein
MQIQKTLRCVSLIVCCNVNIAFAEDIDVVDEQSFHLGFMHPNGVDAAGYSVEKKFNNSIYSFYNFGFPSLAAMGFTYYEEHKGNGLTATAGVVIGFIIYGSIGYQCKIEQQHYLRFGAGLATGVAYSGMYPVISYEYRFEK